MNAIIQQIDEALPRLAKSLSSAQLVQLRAFTELLKAHQRADGGVGALLANARLDASSHRYVVELVHPNELEYRTTPQPAFMKWYCDWMPESLLDSDDEWAFLVLAAGCFESTKKLAKCVQRIEEARLPSEIIARNTVLFVALSNDAFIGSHPRPAE